MTSRLGRHLLKRRSRLSRCLVPSPPGTWKVMTSIWLEEFVEIADELHLAVEGGRRREEGIEADDVHFHRQWRGWRRCDRCGPGRRRRASCRPVACPGRRCVFSIRAVPDRSAGVGCGDFAGQRHHQRQGVLGGRERGGLGGVHHQDALGGGGFEIDVVHAHAGPGDGLELAGVVQNFGGDFRARADDQRIVFADDRGQFVFLEPDFDVKRCAGAA